MGRALLKELGPMPEGLPLLMDRAYEGNETRIFLAFLCFAFIVEALRVSVNTP